jgi:hypothetical protein
LPPNENNPPEKIDNESREMKTNNNTQKKENIPEINNKYRNENTTNNKTIDNTNAKKISAKRQFDRPESNRSKPPKLRKFELARILPMLRELLIFCESIIFFAIFVSKLLL